MRIWLSIIDEARAATKVGEKPIAQQAAEDLNRKGLDDKPKNEDPFAKYKIQDTQLEQNGINAVNPTPIPNEDTPTQGRMQVRADMENIRGGLNVTGKKDESSRNINDVEDPNFLGGSRYKKGQLVTQDNDIQYIDKAGYEILVRKKKT